MTEIDDQSRNGLPCPQHEDSLIAAALRQESTDSKASYLDISLPKRCLPEEASRRICSGDMNEAIRLLPEDYRRVLVMYDLLGRSVTEIAKAMGRSEGSVFMLRAGALRRLRDIMKRVSADSSGPT